MTGPSPARSIRPLLAAAGLCRACAAATFLLLSAAPESVQADANWDGDAGSGDFTDAFNWYNNTVPSFTFANGNLVFNFRNQASQLNQYYNFASWANINDIIWETTWPVDTTFNGNGNGLNFNQRLENRSSKKVIIGTMRLSGGKNGATQIELNPVNGDLQLEGDIYNDNNLRYKVYGSNGKMLTISTVLGGNQNVALDIEGNSLVKIARAQTMGSSAAYNIKQGELWISGSGSLASGSTISLGEANANTAKLYLDGADDGHAITVANTGGTKVIGALDASGTRTYSGNITLNGGVNLEATQSGGTVDFTGVVSGNSGATISGAGTVKLSGNNTFTGGTTVNSGTLLFGNNDRLANSGAFTINGGTANLGGFSETVGAVAINGGTIANGTLSGSSYTGQAGTVSAVLAGSTGLTKSGSGILYLSGANTYSGSTTISAGSLEAQSANALGSTAAGTTVNSGAELRLWNSSGVTYAAEALALNGSGVSSGGALRNTGGNNTWSGAITLGGNSRINSDAGTLTIDVASGDAIAGNFNLTFGGSGNVTINDAIATSGGTLVKDGSGTLTLAAANRFTGGTYIDRGAIALTTANAASNGVIAIGQGAAGGGDARLVLNAANGTTFTNNIEVRNTGGNRFIEFGGAGGVTNTILGNITNNNGFQATNSAGSLVLNGVISGSGGLEKAGSGTVILAGSSANSYSGATTVSGGTLVLNKSADTAAVSGQVTVNSGATLRTDAANQLNNRFIVNNGSLNFNNNGQSLALGGSGTVTIGSATMTNNNNNNDTFSGRITGSGGLVKTGSGTLNLSGTSDYAGTTALNQGLLSISGTQSSSGYTLSGGSLTTSAGANLADNASVSLSNSASTFTVGATDTIGSIGGTAGTINITNSGTLTLGANTTSTFSGIVSGDGSLVKGGTGTLTFDGSSANTYSGTTTVNGGTLVLSKNGVNALAGTPTINSGAVIRLGADNQFAGDTTFLTVNSGGLFDLNNRSETLAIQGAGTVSLGSGTMTINPTQTDTFSGVITGSGGIVKVNSGTQILSGNNSYSGSTTISAGILVAASANALGVSGGTTTVNSGGALYLSNATSMTVAEDMTINGEGTSGALRNVSGDNTISGNITLGSGARINSSTAGSLAIQGSITGSNNVLSIGGSRNMTISGAISGAGAIQDGTITSLYKDSPGVLTLSGNNTYSGDTRITNGNITVASGGNLGNGTSDVYIATNASLTVNTNATVASLREWGTSNGGTATIVSGATLTVAGNDWFDYMNSIGGAGNLVKSGTGTMNLYGTQSYSGTTTVSGGKLSTGVALGSSGVTVSGGTFETTAADILTNTASVTLNSGTYALGGSDTVGSFAIAGGSLTTTNSATLTASTYTLQGGTVSANLGTGTATASSGTTALNGTFAGNLNVTGGTVNLGAADRIGGSSSVNISSGAMSLGTFNDTIGSFGISGGSLNGSGTLTAATYALQGGTVNAALGAGAVTVSSGTTTLGSAGRLNSSATLAVNSGQLNLGGDESIAGLSGAGGVINLGANRLTTTIASGISSYTGGAISGTGGGITKSGAGTFSLGGTHSYTGGTAVSGGELRLVGVTLSSSSVSVSSGAKLGGYGSVGALGGAGSIDPGNSPGIITTTQIDPSGGLDFNFEFTGLAPIFSNPVSSVNDLIRITGATPFSQSLNVGNTINIYFSGAALYTGGAAKQIQGGFFADTNAANFANSISGASYTYYFAMAGGGTIYNGQTYGTQAQYQATNGFNLTITATNFSQGARFDGVNMINGQILQFEVIPEPSTYALLVLSGLALGFHAYRRRLRQR